MPERVLITGTGVVSPAGLGGQALWKAVTDGQPRTSPVTRFDVSGYPHQCAGQLSDEDVAALGSVVPVHESLAARYLAAAALEALESARLDLASTAATVGLFVGTVMGTRPVLDRGVGPGRLAMTGHVWAEPRRLLDVVRAVVPIDGPTVLLGPGCSSGNEAIAAGARAIADGEVDIAICGGADELSLEVFAMFTSLRALAHDVIRPFDVSRKGTMPGEGAGVLVLERPGLPGRRVEPLAELLAAASAGEAHHLTNPRPDGEGLIRAMTDCLARAGRSASDVDWVCAHGTGTVLSDGIEASATAAALGGSGRRPLVSSVKGILGHSQGAASAIEAVLATWSIVEQTVPGNGTLREPDPVCAGIDLGGTAPRATPVRTVLNSAFGFGGGVSVLALGRPEGGDHVR
ncbi:beta-ketoacyl synthase N-terminal-like domain-containing protein [Amycolatopsis nigrescens]|uniref:beta-ketoacyl synthase N-terminal-like domain-containing protein n=1 Tax=Amycolatopsis nigrescens TaxID=381445 RepID=UPI00036C45E2|nr:beta-ketoacyl synthase N-terminal-like domain-containing protein [Amycolatopsis nigrescens]